MKYYYLLSLLPLVTTPHLFGEGVRDGMHVCTLAVRAIQPGEVPESELDSLPAAIAFAPVEYPRELKGSSLTGRVEIGVLIKEDGTPGSWRVTGGNDDRFKMVVMQAIKDWRFGTPMKNAKPAIAEVHYTVFISENGVVRIEQSSRRPNQALPTPTAVTPAASHPSRQQ